MYIMTEIILPKHITYKRKEADQSHIIFCNILSFSIQIHNNCYKITRIVPK